MKESQADGPRAAETTEAAPVDLQEALRGYPTNHTYRIVDGRLKADRKLAARWRTLSRFYPSRVVRFLDVGSCRGYFVFRLAERPECEAAVGIDVCGGFVDTANAVAARLGRSDVRFLPMALEEAAADPAAIGGPFDMVQLISVYHYMYWGSALDSRGAFGHAQPLEQLATLCRGTVIFANPLNVDQAPTLIRQAAVRHPDHDYTPDAFMAAAARWFDIRQVGYLQPLRRRRPILLLTRKSAT